MSDKKSKSKFCMLKNLTLTTDNHKGQVLVNDIDEKNCCIDVELKLVLYEKSTNGNDNITYYCRGYHYGAGDVRDHGYYTKKGKHKLVDVVVPKDLMFDVSVQLADETWNYFHMSAEKIANDRAAYQPRTSYYEYDTKKYLDFFESKFAKIENQNNKLINVLINNNNVSDEKIEKHEKEIVIQKVVENEEPSKDAISSIFFDKDIVYQSRREAISSQNVLDHFHDVACYDVPCLRVYEGQRGTDKNDINIHQVDINRKSADLYFWVNGLHLSAHFTEPKGMIIDRGEKDSNGRHVCTIRLPEDFQFTVIGYKTNPNEYGVRETVNLEREDRRYISMKDVYELREGLKNGREKNIVESLSEVVDSKVLVTESESFDDYGK